MAVSIEDFRYAGSYDPAGVYRRAGRLADFMGCTVETAREQLLGEVVLLRQIQHANHEDMEEHGVIEHAFKRYTQVYKAYTPKAKDDHRPAKERPWLIREDMYGTFMTHQVRRPIDLVQFIMRDELDYSPATLLVGKPDTNGQLVLFEGFTEEHYLSIARGLKRIREQRSLGLLPNMDWDLTCIDILVPGISLPLGYDDNLDYSSVYSVPIES